MCGIAGFVRPRENPQAAALRLEQMVEALAHRGPDAFGFWHEPTWGISLGHRRLAIRDLSPLGRQPMASHTGQFQLVYNGEIYNTEQLRERLPKNLRLRGSSDTELLLAGFEHWGVLSTLRQVAGMFALAVFGRKERSLTLARDRLGIKPLVYCHDGAQLHFSSELKGLLAVPDFDAQVDTNSLCRFLQYGYVPEDTSILSGVQKLMPGTALTFRLDAMERTPLCDRYWDAPSIADHQQQSVFRESEEEIVDALDDQLCQIVHQHLAADVPLGAFLSSGIDSSLVLAIMRKVTGGNVRTFTVGFDDRRFDEAQVAGQVARHLGSEHTEYTLTMSEVAQAVPDVMRLYCEPLADTSAIPTYCLARLARQSVTVALSGDGGDELLGGYRRYWHAPALSARLERIPGPLRHALAACLRLPGPSLLRPWDRAKHLLAGRRIHDSLAESVRKMARTLSSQSLQDLYGCFTTISFNAHEQNSVVLDRPRRQAGLPGPWNLSRAPLANMQLWDTAIYLPNDILHKVDMATMAVGLEARVPLLDHRLFEWAWRLPATMKTDGTLGKLVARRLLRRYLPESLIGPQKQGFSAPLSQWLRGPLKTWALDLLADETIDRVGLLNTRVVRRYTQEFYGGISSHARLWPILVFLSWNEHHLAARERNHYGYCLRHPSHHSISFGGQHQHGAHV